MNLRTGLRAAPGDAEAIVEAFKPGEEPDDAYSVIGFSQTTDGTGDAYQPADPYAPAPQPPPPQVNDGWTPGRERW